MKSLLSIVITLCLLIQPGFSQTWIPQGIGLLPFGYEVNSISVVHDSVVWVSASLKNGIFHPVKIFRSVNAGNDWQISDLTTCEFCRVRKIEAIDANTAWLTIQGDPGDGRLYKTVDGGKTWTLMHSSSAAGQGIEIYDDQHIACRSAYSFAWSEDGGEQWMTGMMTSIPSAFYPYSYTSRLQSDTAWFGMEGTQWYTYQPTNAKLIRTTHYGSDYSLLDTGIDSVAVMDLISFADSKIGIMKFIKWVPTLDWDLFPAFTWSDQHQLARTTDGGISWSVLPTVLNNIRSITTVPGAPQTFIVAGESHFYKTIDSGETWEGGELHYPHCCLDFSSPAAGWMAINGTSGNHPLVLKWNGGILSGIKEDPEMNPVKISISPNPTTDMIRYNLGDGLPLVHTLKVTNAAGQVVIQKQTEGQELSLRQLPDGIYLLHVYTTDQKGVARIIKH